MDIAGMHSSDVVAQFTGFPVGGWYAIDKRTGINLGQRTIGTMPKRFKRPEDALIFGGRLLARPWSHEQLQLAVLTLVAQLGGLNFPERHLYSMRIDTLYGTLVIKPQEDWISCQFDDADTAREAPGPIVDRKSGRWNFHGEADERRETFLRFAECLREIAEIAPGLQGAQYAH